MIVAAVAVAFDVAAVVAFAAAVDVFAVVVVVENNKNESVPIF